MPNREVVVSDTSFLLKRRVARRHDLEVTGVIGVLLRGANDGEVNLEHELDALREAEFWISDDLYSRALSEVDEQHF